MHAVHTLDTIRAHLDKEPKDWQARRELADLLEEAGRDDEARLQRWLVQWKRAPHYMPTFQPVAMRYWYWWSNSTNRNNEVHCLGGMVMRMSPKMYSDGGYATREEAERELLLLLIRENWPDLS